MTDESNVLIKGIREGLLISVQTGSWEINKAEILRLVNEKKDFFSGAHVCLEVGETILRVTEITQMRDALSDLGVNLKAILSQSEVTMNNAKALGFETKLVGKKDTHSNDQRTEDSGEKAVLIHKTLRAGYRVEAREHVMIIGDVNPGAEIVTAGSIFVWGKLKGSAVAGVEGNGEAVICALELRPTQLRIGDIVFPPMSKKGNIFPEIAFLKNGQSTIEIWNNEKGK